MNETGTGFWDTAYRDNAPALLGVLRRYAKDASVAQDLLHEVFITAINKYGSYTGKGCFEGWLHRIAVNTALMYLRNEKNKQVPAEAVLSVADDADDDRADDARTAIEAAGFSGEELLSAIDRLPEHHKLVFNMYVMDDFSHRQISAELNISPGTSKSHLARARKKIQQYLYDDALKKKLKDRRRASTILLLFPARTHFIDRLYRQKLSDFSLPPAGGTEFLSAALEQHAASTAASTAQAVTSAVSTVSQTAATTAASSASAVTQAVTTTAFWGGKLSYAVLCCGTAAVTGSVCWVSMSENSPFNRREDMSVPVADTLTHASKPAATDSIAYHAADHFLQAPSPAPSQESNDAPSIRNATNSPQENEALSSNVENAAQSGTDRTSETDEALTTQARANTPPAAGKAIDLPKSGGNTRSAAHQADSTRSSGEKTPVVVKKQIIQHQTVVVRDTIIITE
ncbi:MAG: sigma-70 family RNA polymerase sigma factor [Bacteroidales bacterium]|jgi:RNA polymerase sigma factor (sigma-70 family)|nr:sigma-70 family RNA polymerase sigma factor [Bacteroidales bacterium]